MTSSVKLEPQNARPCVGPRRSRLCASRSFACWSKDASTAGMRTSICSAQDETCLRLTCEQMLEIGYRPMSHTNWVT